MKDYIQIGIEKGLISLNEDRSWITYGYQKKERKVFLYMKCVRQTAMLYFGGSAGQQRVPASYLENFDIPMPPKEKQMEIVGHIYQLRQRAKTLQEEGKCVLEETKQGVERMILKTNVNNIGNMLKP